MPAMNDNADMGRSAGGGDEAADARMGMIQVNDLVYKLDTDLSVAISRTHKTQFFQNVEYSNQQTAITIVNSGADYVDPRRSFVTFDVIIPTTALGTNIANADYQNAFVSAYFGKNGSVLNLIDSVVVSSRSGDELSRVNDFGQLSHMMVPEMFGPDWRDTIGQQLGLGSHISGRNDGTLANPVLVEGLPYRHQGEQRRTRFSIPLYLLSPIFNYGRLLPSMLMSGLRIELKWKDPGVAFQQFWEGFPQEFPTDGAHWALMDDDQTDFKTYLGTSLLSGDGALNTAIFPPSAVEYKLEAAGTAWLLTMRNFTGVLGFLLNNAITGLPEFQPGDKICFSNDNNLAPRNQRSWSQFTILSVEGNDHMTVSDDFGGGAFAYVLPGALTGGAGTYIGAWRLSQRRSNGYQRDFGAPVLHGKFLTPVTPFTSYTIRSPQIAMSCIQLTDAIQRTLNEFSSINGLEIVYADYDRTSAPLTGAQTGVYTEVRKSASRALCAFARVVRATANPYRYDSFASAPDVYWNGYQWQLGSLYFPQQRVESKNSVNELKWDTVLTDMYAYTQDAFDRYHPKAAPTMASFRGTGIDFNKLNLHPTEVHAEHSPSTYLAPYNAFGKWGSFVHGGTTVATTLERSSLFDLSGIPINNSRVLALLGDLDMSIPVASDAAYRAQLYIFLKYVRLARVFLVNCEVEQ
jgi:hypothetical protein